MTTFLVSSVNSMEIAKIDTSFLEVLGSSKYNGFFLSN